MRVYIIMATIILVGGYLLDRAFPGLTMRDPLALFFVAALLTVGLFVSIATTRIGGR